LRLGGMAEVPRQIAERRAPKKTVQDFARNGPHLKGGCLTAHLRDNPDSVIAWQPD